MIAKNQRQLKIKICKLPEEQESLSDLILIRVSFQLIGVSF